MKKITTHQNGIRYISFSIMIFYLFVLMLSMKYTINLCLGMFTVFMGIISIVLQTVLFFIGIREQSDYKGNNNKLKILLMFVIVFLFSAFKF